jgi:hypothetical protein
MRNRHEGIEARRHKVVERDQGIKCEHATASALAPSMPRPHSVPPCLRACLLPRAPWRTIPTRFLQNEPSCHYGSLPSGLSTQEPNPPVQNKPTNPHSRLKIQAFNPAPGKTNPSNPLSPSTRNSQPARAPRRTIPSRPCKTNPLTWRSLAHLASWRSAFPSHHQKLQNEAMCHSVPPAQTRHNLPKPATPRVLQFSLSRQSGSTFTRIFRNQHLLTGSCACSANVPLDSTRPSRPFLRLGGVGSV